MPRAQRVQYEGAIYHVFTTGVRDSRIYVTQQDRDVFSSTLDAVCQRTGWEVYCDCQMGTHYHLLLSTPAGNLAEGMQLLNSTYATRFNARHDLKGHVFKGRYGSRLVKTNEYALEMIRYIALNPVRAGLVDTPETWRWGSYRALIGLDDPQPYLRTDWVLEQFHVAVQQARASLSRFVHAGMEMDDLDRPSLGRLLTDASPGCIRKARDVYGYTLQQIADYLGVSVATVSRRSRQ